MIEIFLNVAKQVAILFVLILLGIITSKAKILNKESAKGVTNFVLFFVTPCVIIKSFASRRFSADSLKALLLGFFLAIVIHLLFIALSRLIIHSKDKRTERIFLFGAVFSNCGFMSLPLQQALLGDDGVFFGASFVAIFNLFLWSYGTYTISGDKSYLISKKSILNPGVIGLIIGVIIFVCSIPLPSVIYEPISYLAALNTPLPMMLIGFYLANSNVLGCIKSVQCLFSVFLRLILLPTSVLGIIWLCGIRGTMFISLSISASAPIAATSTMFAERFGGKTDLSANLVSLSTLFSIITMPVIVILATLVS